MLTIKASNNWDNLHAKHSKKSVWLGWLAGCLAKCLSDWFLLSLNVLLSFGVLRVKLLLLLLVCLYVSCCLCFSAPQHMQFCQNKLRINHDNKGLTGHEIDEVCPRCRKRILRYLYSQLYDLYHKIRSKNMLMTVLNPLSLWAKFVLEHLEAI